MKRLGIYKIMLCCWLITGYSGGWKLCCQTHKVDSMRIVLNSATSPEKKQFILLKICEQNYSLSADSLAKYVSEGLKLSQENSAAHFQFKNYYCFYFLKKGEAKVANLYMDSLQKVMTSKQVDKAIHRAANYHKAVCLVRNNQYKESISSAFHLLESAEKANDTLSVLRAYSLLGWANMELESEHEAIKWLRKGLNYSQNEQYLANANSLCLNISSCYNLIEEPDSALRYIELGLKYCRSAENLTSEANALNIRAAIYSKSDKTKEALKDLEDALVIRQKIGDMHYIIADMAQLSHFYAYVKQSTKGIDIALKAIPLATQTNNLYKLIYIKKGLYKNYEVAHRTNDQISTLLEILDLKDSLYEQNTANEIAEIKTQYELQKRENIIIQQKHNLARNRYFSIGGAVAFLLASIIVWLLYRNRSHRQKLNMEQALIEEKLHSLQAVKHAEEKERKRIAADLHDNLGSYAAAISSNIRYLKINDHSENHKIITQLDENAQGIVTQLGDTIWILKNESLPVTKLADRFKAWAQRLIQNFPDVIYDYREDIKNDIELTPGTALNIFLILKECLNNALKHSHCHAIRIEIECDKELFITLADDGRGIEDHEMKNGNGIENIRHRAKECGLKVDWGKLQPSGTRITIFGPTTN